MNVSKSKISGVLMCLGAIIGGLLHFIDPTQGIDYMSTYNGFLTGLGIYGIRSFLGKRLDKNL